MKALLVADTDTTAKTVARYLKPYGFDVIRYRSAVKALDNIEEIAPDAVFISAGDFPRHWKAIAQFIRSDTEKEKTVVILLTNDRFTAEDADKAVHIGVQAIVGESLSGLDEERKLGEVFARYRHVGAAAEAIEIENPGNSVTFMFTNPANDTIITGIVECISRQDLRFRPDSPAAAANLGAGVELDQCSLKIGAATLSPRCRIRKNGNLIILEFAGLEKREAAAIDAFIGGAGSEA
jgi:CheY-like chemotaxis protein